MIYRTEHPKPQFMRSSWQNLNGLWDFEIDNGLSGEDRGWHNPEADFSKKINVPFCPESKLSGIENVDFMPSVWYKRSFDISSAQLEGCVKLHFGAVDYEAVVYINGKLCGTHKGGYCSFSFDITEHLKEGNNTITVWAKDDTLNRLVPSGKQSDKFHSYGCFYTRTTGIWQTVWLEFMPKCHIENVKYYPQPESGSVTIQAQLQGAGDLKARVTYGGKVVGVAEAKECGGNVTLNIPLSELHLWEVGKGRLYDVKLSFGDDVVGSYFGMRSVRLEGNKFLINGRTVFQRLVLDQGFYPDGIYTSPSDDELRSDVERSLALGFNGARLHEKIFEERFLYHCDKLGYIVWAEYPNWGLDHTYADSIYGMLPEWLEEINRDFNHPAIIGWCPFNETWLKNDRRQFDELLRLVYKTTKALDPTRPCIDTSGGFHVETDIYDLHDYYQNPEEFRSHYLTLGKENTFDFNTVFGEYQIPYDGKMPFFVSEYGGIRWTDDKEGWGYGDAPKTPEEFLERLEKLTDVLLDNPRMFGLCYTQLTDVEQEQNGLYTYDRKPKFPAEKIYKIFSKKAAIEE